VQLNLCSSLYSACKMLLKLRQKPSSYPPWVQTEADQDKNIEEYRIAEGLMLGSGYVAKYPGQHFLAELIRYSMWGNGRRIRTRHWPYRLKQRKNFAIRHFVALKNQISCFPMTM
jgi:hypothetical protein